METKHNRNLVKVARILISDIRWLAWRMREETKTKISRDALHQEQDSNTVYSDSLAGVKRCTKSLAAFYYFFSRDQDRKNILKDIFDIFIVKPRVLGLSDKKCCNVARLFQLEVILTGIK